MCCFVLQLEPFCEFARLPQNSNSNLQVLLWSPSNYNVNICQDLRWQWPFWLHSVAAMDTRVGSSSHLKCRSTVLTFEPWPPPAYGEHSLCRWGQRSIYQQAPTLLKMSSYQIKCKSCTPWGSVHPNTCRDTAAQGFHTDLISRMHFHIHAMIAVGNSC